MRVSFFRPLRRLLGLCAFELILPEDHARVEC